MKTDLGHLPARKQRELEYLVKVLFEEFEAAEKRIKPRNGKHVGGRILKIILFGSYARGGWVEDHLSGYYSDYDILVVVDKDYLADALGFWNTAEERLLFDPNFKTPVNFITHTIADVNAKLGEGQYFFSDIQCESIVLYEYPNGRRLREPAVLDTKEAYSIANDYYERWMKKAVDVFESRSFFLERDNFNQAAFQLHQATESFYQCVLLVLTNYTPATHNLKTLRSITERLDERLRTVWPQEKRFEKRCFELLKEAYVKARYSKHYKISSEELGWLGERVEVLRDVVKAVCEERLAHLKIAAGVD